ncbi:DUF998 domain-containing protein [Candidatus Bathyarchaeota archaeon]|nr:DUF998 domain-containing protein [Candidatus Bathyarchaeota archaeon]
MAGAFLFIGAAQFLLCLVVGEALYSGYSVSSNYISELGVGSTAILFNGSVFVLGVAVMAGAYLLRETCWYGVLPYLLMLCGVGCMGTAIFPYIYGMIHSLFALISFLFGALATIVSCSFQEAPMKHICVVLGAVSLMALVLFMVGEIYLRYCGILLNLGIGLGGMERLIVYPILIWALGFGGLLIGKKKQEPDRN